MNIDELTTYAFDRIKKTKGQVINIDEVSEMLKEKLGDQYTGDIGVSVKSNLRDHDKIDFFKQGDYNHDQKFYYCVGNWLAIKGLYGNAIEAKEKIGVLSWQSHADDWEE